MKALNKAEVRAKAEIRDQALEEPAPVSADKTLLTICKRGKKLWNI